MNYRQLTVTTARYGYDNLVGLIAVSLLSSFAFVPLIATAFIGTSIALLGGLWATCLLLGIVTAAAFQFTTTVTKRGVSVAVLPNVITVVWNPATGIAVGAVTFAVVVTATALIAAVPGTFRPIVTGVAGFLLVAWYLLVAFAAPELGDNRGLKTALRASAIRLDRAPGPVAWFLILSFACTLLAGATVVTFVLFLPGILALLASQAALGFNAESEEYDP